MGQNKRELFPKRITYLTEKIIQVASGNDHTLFLDIGGNVYATGSNDFG
jgi:alpha-tubulin suppressor-like RCC1 family protein